MKWPVLAVHHTSGPGAWLASRTGGARLHAGLDLPGAPGTIVVAPETSVVLYVGEASRPGQPNMSRPRRGWSGYGPMLCVLRGQRSGAFYLLAHLGSVGVRDGGVVDEGAQLGTIGGPSHCHFEVRDRFSPPPGLATVEICADPIAWVDRDEWKPWRHGVDPCPPSPGNSRETPRACRPSWSGPTPPPAPPPTTEGSGPFFRAARAARSQPGEVSRG